MTFKEKAPQLGEEWVNAKQNAFHPENIKVWADLALKPNTQILCLTVPRNCYLDPVPNKLKKSFTRTLEKIERVQKQL